MGNLLTYLLYALALIAVVIAMEGVWFLIRGVVGKGRAVNLRLERAGSAREAAAPSAADPAPARPLARLIDARAPWLGIALERSRSRLSPSQVLLASLAVFVLVFMLISFTGAPRLLAVLAALGLSLGSPWAILSILVNRRRKRFLDQLPQAVDLIARSLQAGHPVTNAMTVVAKQMPDPIGPEFNIVIQEMTYGLDRGVALENLVGRFPLPEMRMFVASLEVTRESGGNLAEVFLKLSDAIRAKAQLRKKVEAISAEGRLSFWVVSALPVVVGGSLMIVRPSFYLDVAKDPLFWPMMAFSPLMLVIGATIIWRMVNIRI